MTTPPPPTGLPPHLQAPLFRTRGRSRQQRRLLRPLLAGLLSLASAASAADEPPRVLGHVPVVLGVRVVEQIEQFPIRVGERTFRIGDVAKVHRGFNDPPAPRMRFMGEDAGLTMLTTRPART